MPDERPGQERDIAFMRRALDLASRGWGQTAPNPMVGAVVVRGDEVVGEGWHARFGEAHAEVMALRAAGERARGATMYVTLEPCNHHGKTPPCSNALVAAGVQRVVAATRDPSPAARGGAERLTEHAIAVDFGVEEAAARELNAVFFHALTSARPWVTLKLATSLDGAIADAQRTRGWLTNELSRREVHRMRAGSDAVAVGLGTVEHDDPALTVREVDAPRIAPARVVFDREARIPLESTLVRTARETPVVVVAAAPPRARADALRQAGVTVIEANTMSEALAALKAHGVRALLVEGGARLSGALLTDALVDRLVIFQAPIVLGPGALNAFAHVPAATVAHVKRLAIVDRQTLGDDVMTTYAFGDR